MELVVERLAGDPIEQRNVEVVERKGLGHPDTICDALAEELSLGLSRFYLEHAGGVLHHNVDKVLLFGGASVPRFGGGEVSEPIQIYLCGRAISECGGVRVPIEELAVEGTRRWIEEHLRALDASAHLVVHPLVRPGSPELVELFERQRAQGDWLANDTSCGVGYAPLSELERLVLRVEQELNAREERDAHPEGGEDVKVMGVRHGSSIELTVARAFVDRHVRDVADYEARKAALRERATAIARSCTDREVTVQVNAADDPARESLYLTVTGTSAESGDDGEAGRGNRWNGLISPYRPMTMESVAGKNPVTHVGKIYNVVAELVAADVVEQVPEVVEATCHLVSRIGNPVSDPQIADVRLRGPDPTALVENRIAEIVRRRLEHVDTLWKDLVSGALAPGLGTVRG